MNWGRVVLVFQAIVTLIIGLVFFIQVFNIEYNYEEKVRQDYETKNIDSKIVYNQLAKYEEFKHKFFTASYILVIVSIIEVIIIWRLFSVSIGQDFEFKNEFSLTFA